MTIINLHGIFIFGKNHMIAYMFFLNDTIHDTPLLCLGNCKTKGRVKLRYLIKQFILLILQSKTG